MYLERRKRKDGTVQYRFTYVDKDGVRRRFPQSKVPHLRTDAEAESFRKSQAAIMETKRADIERKLNWKSRFHDFEKLLAEKYMPWQMERAPNSWESSVYYLEQWVFPFYLQEKQSTNAGDWYVHFREFRDWLAGPQMIQKRGEKGPLAISTRNNIIKALNTFLECMKAYGEVDPTSAQKCEAYPEHMLNRRDADDLIPEEERDAVLVHLKKLYAPAADFFQVLWHTGMRFNELFGLPITGLFRGEVEAGPLKAELERYSISYVGYLYLESQPVHEDRRREEDFSIKRKPLKGCREISPKHARVIPIRDKEVWNILARRYKAQMELYEKGTFGPDKNQYMFFEDAEWNKTTEKLRIAYDRLKRRTKSYHCCRHTFITELVGATRSYFLVRMITGQKSQKAFERYLHIYEKIARQAKQKAQEIDLLD